MRAGFTLPTKITAFFRKDHRGLIAKNRYRPYSHASLTKILRSRDRLIDRQVFLWQVGVDRPSRSRINTIKIDTNVKAKRKRERKNKKEQDI
ncbi:uncharacterized protein LOC143181286 isoform X2 [Calliopsis andreniformis]|uniref:uncharacterized protein LOC143181286 isoform X2 n=1 Tax=Calliopsis andreniformis TaxID=337506 RepID=UPI003FCC7E11